MCRHDSPAGVQKQVRLRIEQQGVVRGIYQQIGGTAVSLDTMHFTAMLAEAGEGGGPEAVDLPQAGDAGTEPVYFDA